MRTKSWKSVLGFMSLVLFVACNDDTGTVPPDAGRDLSSVSDGMTSDMGGVALDMEEGNALSAVRSSRYPSPLTIKPGVAEQKGGAVTIQASSREAGRITSYFLNMKFGNGLKAEHFQYVKFMDTNGQQISATASTLPDTDPRAGSGGLNYVVMGGTAQDIELILDLTSDAPEGGTVELTYTGIKGEGISSFKTFTLPDIAGGTLLVQK